MKVIALLAVIGVLGFAGPLQASKPCMMVAQYDTPAIEDPSSVWKKGVSDGVVTELDINNKTGARSFCLHGGYCYPASVNVGGRKVEAFRLTNCRVKAGSGTNEGDHTSYEVEGIPARAQAQTPAADPEIPKDIQVVRGYCSEASFSANGPEAEDISRYKRRFDCDGAALFFLDNENKRITIRFLSSKHIKDGPILGFTGVMQEDGKSLDVKSVYYLDPNSRPIPTVKDSYCSLVFDEKSMAAILCFAHFNSGGDKYIGLIDFRAATGQ